MTKCQITCKSLQKSSKCQNFLRVWDLVIFWADQLKKPPCSFYKTFILYSDLFPHSTSCTWPLPLALLGGTWFRISQENHIGGKFLLKLLGVPPWKDIFHYILPGQVRLGHGRGQEEQAQGQDEVHNSANSNLSTSTH